MSVLEMPRSVGSIDLPPAPDVPLGTMVEPPAIAAGTGELTDAEFAMLFRQGVKWGIPVMYGITSLLCLIAVPGYYPLLIAALLPAVAGGWYFGGIVALAALYGNQD